MINKVRISFCKIFSKSKSLLIFTHEVKYATKKCLVGTVNKRLRKVLILGRVVGGAGWWDCLLCVNLADHLMHNLCDH